MNITEKYEKPFFYAGIILNALVAYQFCMLWLAPSTEDVSKILSFASLMAFEFIMVHSGIFMAFMPKRISLFILIPFYGVFALIFGTIAKDNFILISYLLVVFNRMRYAFSDVSPEIKGQVMIRSIGAMGIYFCLIFIVLIFQWLIPEMGLNKAFLNTAGYYDNLTSSGVFVETPHIAIVFGLIYYVFLAIFEAYLLPISNNNEKNIPKQLVVIDKYKAFINKKRHRKLKK